MSKIQNSPVTKSDSELLFRLLDLVTQEIHRLFDFGSVLGETTDFEVERTKAKIASKQDEVRRLRQLLAKTRGYIQRRKQINKERQRN